jgi:hypothetical protein
VSLNSDVADFAQSYILGALHLHRQLCTVSHMSLKNSGVADFARNDILITLHRQLCAVNDEYFSSSSRNSNYTSFNQVSPVLRFPSAL